MLRFVRRCNQENGRNHHLCQTQDVIHYVNKIKSTFYLGSEEDGASTLFLGRLIRENDADLLSAAPLEFFGNHTTELVYRKKEIV